MTTEPTRYRPGAYGAMVPDATGPFIRYDDAIVAAAATPMDREQLLRQVAELADAAAVAGESLLHNALMGILLASQLPFPLRRTMLNGILTLPAFGLWSQQVNQ